MKKTWLSGRCPNDITVCYSFFLLAALGGFPLPREVVDNLIIMIVSSR
jgi:hypothetical protein